MSIVLKSQRALLLALGKSLDLSARSISTIYMMVPISNLGKIVLTERFPSLGKAMYNGLATGQFICPEYFGRQPRTELPKFLYEFFSEVFTDEGVPREVPSGIAMSKIRTLTFFFYKFEERVTADVQRDAIQKFIETDQRVMTDYSKTDHGINLRIRKVLAAIFEGFDPQDTNPVHSNGATARQGVTVLDKYNKFAYVSKFERYFKYPFFLHRRVSDILDCDPGRPARALPPSRVTFVPKDARGPRTICMEPHETMFYQKGLQKSLYDHIEWHEITRGRVNFTDQSINQILCAQSSITGEYATIDLKDASDLVSWTGVKLYFPPGVVEAFELLRSPTAVLPNSAIVTLKKFAPMGSALCFPVEALFFFAVAYTVTKDVYVYGDDIIVPTRDAQAVMDRLEEYGLVINRDKSFYFGKFRESCGAYYYDGIAIEGYSCKSLKEIQLVALANNLTEVFGQRVGDSVIRFTEEYFGTVYYRAPRGFAPQDFVYRTDYRASNSVFFKRRWNSDLQRHEVRRKSFKTKNGSFQGYGGLRRFLAYAEASSTPAFCRRYKSDFLYTNKGKSLQHFIDKDVVTTRTSSVSVSHEKHDTWLEVDYYD